MTWRPARRIRDTAWRRLAPQPALSRLPIRPTRWILSAFKIWNWFVRRTAGPWNGWGRSTARHLIGLPLFHQHKKFFVAGRAEQGRFNHIPPEKTSPCGNKFAKLLQHAMVNGRVGDH